MKVLYVGILVGLIGCTNPWVIRSGHYPATQESFETILHVPLTVHIVGNRSQFPQHLLTAHPKAVGYQMGNHIYVIGYKDTAGMIHIPHAVLGHELMHVLNEQNWIIVNPDVSYTLVEY